MFDPMHSAADLAGGYVCFVVAISVVGVLTAIIGDLANHVGCTIYLKDSVTATTIVALGTSMPGNAGLQRITLSNTYSPQEVIIPLTGLALPLSAT